MNILTILASSSYLTVNKQLASKIGMNAAVLFAELSSTHTWCEANGKLDEEGMFFETSDSITQNTTFSRRKQDGAIDALKDAGLIDVKRKGLPSKRYFRINEDRVFEILDIDYPGKKRAGAKSRRKRAKPA